MSPNREFKRMQISKGFVWLKTLLRRVAQQADVPIARSRLY